MTGERTFDWWLARTGKDAVARWNIKTVGSRDIHTACPSHGGSDSLHITETPDKVLVNCFAGCAYEDILAAVSDDAQDTQTPVIVRSGRTTRPAYSPTGEPVSDQTDGRWKPSLKPQGVKPSQLHGGRATLDGIDTVIFVEGHGPAIALNDAGIPAVCSVTGKSSAIDSTGAASLFGKRVILSPDVGGEAHMERCGKVIAAVASEVLIAPAWPEEPKDGEDAADFIERYGIAAMAEHFAKAVPWAPRDTSDIAFAWLDEIDLTEPAERLLEFLDSEQHTILFGDGGTGKGVVAAWWAAELTKSATEGQTEPWVVIILDWEQNAHFEWRPRIGAFGGILGRVAMAQPDKAIWDARDEITEVIAIVREKHPRAPLFAVIDSIGYAAMGAPIESSETAVRYKHELDELDVPTLSLAHTTKADADPAHPFGSVFWSNGARNTIGIARDGEGLTAPRVLRNKKTNQRAPFAPVSIPWDWAEGSTLPPSLAPRAHHESLSDRAFDAVYNRGFFTLKEMEAIVTSGGGGTFSFDGLKKAVIADTRFSSDGTSGRGRTARYRAGPVSFRASVD